jgi:hypothetical protein
VKDNIEKLRKSVDSFKRSHEFKEGMAVTFKKDFLPKVDYLAVFIKMLPTPFGGDNDNPLHPDNFHIADCIVAAYAVDGSISICLADSRFLEPVIEQDETPLQLELPLDAT